MGAGIIYPLVQSSFRGSLSAQEGEHTAVSPKARLSSVVWLVTCMPGHPLLVPSVGRAEGAGLRFCETVPMGTAVFRSVCYLYRASQILRRSCHPTSARVPGLPRVRAGLTSGDLSGAIFLDMKSCLSVEPRPPGDKKPGLPRRTGWTWACCDPAMGGVFTQEMESLGPHGRLLRAFMAVFYP